MYAIFRQGNHQYKAVPNQTVEMNLLPQEEGQPFETSNVLLVSEENQEPQVGAPYVAGALVKGVIVKHFKGKKIRVFKQKRRKRYQRTIGHRQSLTLVRIESIEKA